MSRSTFTYSTSMELLIGGNALPEVLVDVKFTFYPGSADYFDKGMGCWYPGDHPEVEITQISLRDDSLSLACPAWLTDGIEKAVDTNDLIQYASEILSEREGV